MEIQLPPNPFDDQCSRVSKGQLIGSAVFSRAVPEVCGCFYSHFSLCIPGMAVNWLTDTLYWADLTLKHIMCSQLDGRYHKILIADAGQPKGLAVDAKHR